MSADKIRYEFSLQTKCSRRVPGGSPGYTFSGDKIPDDRTFEGVIKKRQRSIGEMWQLRGSWM